MHVVCVCMCVYVCVCVLARVPTCALHRTHVEVRGHLGGISSLLPYCVSQWKELWALGLGILVQWATSALSAYSKSFFWWLMIFWGVPSQRLFDDSLLMNLGLSPVTLHHPQGYRGDTLCLYSYGMVLLLDWGFIPRTAEFDHAFHLHCPNVTKLFLQSRCTSSHHQHLRHRLPRAAVGLSSIQCTVMLTLNFWPSCRNLLTAGITGVYHFTWLALPFSHFTTYWCVYAYDSFHLSPNFVWEEVSLW